MDRLVALEEILLSADSMPDDAALFLPSGVEWLSSTRAAVLPVDRYAEDDEIPEFAANHGLERVLSVYQVQDVVANARLQSSSATVEMLVEALRFYFQRDAFIRYNYDNR